MKMGHFGSKTRLLGQILEKPCVNSRAHIFSPMLMKLCQTICLDKILEEFENGLCRMKNKATRSDFRKTWCTLFWLHFQQDTHETWSECLPR